MMANDTGRGTMDADDEAEGRTGPATGIRRARTAAVELARDWIDAVAERAGRLAADRERRKAGRPWPHYGLGRCGHARAAPRPRGTGALGMTERTGRAGRR